MENGLKGKLTGWGATVGLAALALVGNVGVGQSASNSEAVTNGSNASSSNAVGSAAVQADAAYRVSQSSPPPPPPPAVGAVRG